ncbi:MAG: SBBP repeat-containing protein, partial [bacterium]|nr:SBBP repeat-containing protein [bacterium]
MRNESGSCEMIGCFMTVALAFAILAPPSGAAPELMWSTYLGGDEVGYDEAADIAYGVAMDLEGNIYVTGYTSSRDWVSGGYDTSYNGVWDIFVAKLTPSGALVWSTYLGGSGTDIGSKLVVDPAGNIYLTGTTGSSDWYAPADPRNLDDAFVAKLSPGGVPLWVHRFSSGVGGSTGIALDRQGSIYVCGGVGSDVPVWVSGGYDTTPNGSGDAFVAKFSPDGAPLWSTYLGGSGLDGARGIATDGAGKVYVAGTTESPDWISGGYDTTLGGDFDGFVVKLSGDGTFLWSTYLGGNDHDESVDVALDRAGNVC